MTDLFNRSPRDETAISSALEAVENQLKSLPVSPQLILLNRAVVKLTCVYLLVLKTGIVKHQFVTTGTLVEIITASCVS